MLVEKPSGTVHLETRPCGGFSLPARFRIVHTDRALVNPEPYLCATFPSFQTARLAAAMLQHPLYVLATLKALGWDDGIDHPE